MKRQFMISVVVIFATLTAVLYALRINMPAFRFSVLETGNTIMALLCLVTYLLVNKQMDGNTQAFVRGVYSASFLRLMVCMVSILVYVLLNRAHIHKPSVFVLFGIYALYTIAETWLLSRIVRE
jgi:hypothetical protein